MSNNNPRTVDGIQAQMAIMRSEIYALNEKLKSCTEDERPELQQKLEQTRQQYWALDMEQRRLNANIMRQNMLRGWR